MPEHSKSFSVESWEALEGRIYQMLISNSIEAEINWRIKSHSQFSTKSLGNIVLARGPTANELKIDKLEQKVPSANPGHLLQQREAKGGA